MNFSLFRNPGGTIAPALGISFALLSQPASAFCGFYVAQAEADLFNDASQVVLVRDKDRTVVTMASDYHGELSEFALVIPVPTVLQRDQVHVTDQSIIDHLDAYTAPRLVEYFDEDPCRVQYELRESSVGMSVAKMAAPSAMEDRDLVQIEATYTVGEYDILILSAKESGALQRWLRTNGYKVPEAADRVLASYLKQGMKFFVAKVNLEEQSKLGVQNLRPLQMAFESEKFMLPIRLGTVNSRGTQDMLVYTLTRTGRVETTNYRTIKIPSGMEIPEYIGEDFGGFYSALFDRECDKANNRGVFLEYAWGMNWCDPCAADPLSPSELKELGVYWMDGRGDGPGRGRRGIAPPIAARDVFVTRLHVRYDGEHFPEDLAFQETGDRTNFQGRYVTRRPWTGDISCGTEIAANYRSQLQERQENEARTLANLTGWELADIHRDMDFADGWAVPANQEPWWKAIWKN